MILHLALSQKDVPNRAVIVIDNGSSFIKGGVAGEDVPRTVLNTVVGESLISYKYLVN